MSKRFFEREIAAISRDSRDRSHNAASELERELRRQLRRSFGSSNAAFNGGIKLYQFDSASYVRLDPLLSQHAKPQKISGSPKLWILLPDGARLGFKRIGKDFSWRNLQRRYSTNLSFVPVADGHVVLFRWRGKTSAIYKIQAQTQTSRRLKFEESAQVVGKKYGFE